MPTPDPNLAASSSAPSATTDDAAALERALLDGLGLPELKLPGGLTPALMHTLGELMREMTRGTLDLLRTRAETKSSLHADMTMIGSRSINPLKTAWDAEIALKHLLARQRADMMPGVDAVADAYDDLRLHDRGLASGIQAALTGLLARFAPEEIERRLGDAHRFDGILPAGRKARRWELLVEIYEDLSVEAKQDFWAMFEKEFRRAYTLGQPPRKAASTES